MLKQANDAPFRNVYLSAAAYKRDTRGCWTEVHCTNNSCVILEKDLSTEHYDLLGCYTAEWMAP